MPRWFKVTASIIAVVIGQGWLALNVIGNLATAVDIFDWVPMWIRTLAAHKELAYQIGPWMFIVLGIGSLLAVHLWPERRGQETPPTPRPLATSPEKWKPGRGGVIDLDLPNPEIQVTPEMVRAMRIAKSVAKAGEELQRAYEEAERELSRKELKAEAVFVRGFDPNSAEARNAALLLLTRLRADGVKLRNEPPEYLFPEDFDAWAATIAGWMNEVIEALKPISLTDAEWFATLDTVPAARVPIPNIRLGTKEDRARFESVFRQHDYRLARLDRLLGKYGVGAT